MQINPGQLTQGGHYTFFSNYGSTYELIGIDLFDAVNNLLTDWTLTDLTTNATVFTPTGRVTTSVPEPATLALFGAGLVGLALSFRRRARTFN